jgi:hypothetical protein
VAVILAMLFGRKALVNFDLFAADLVVKEAGDVGYVAVSVVEVR